MTTAVSFETAAQQKTPPDLPPVIWVCPTFRKENDNSEAYFVRYYSLISLYQQFLDQDYPQDRIELRIADASATPHEFFATLNDRRVKYMHIPDRSDATRQKIEAEHPGTGKFLLSDADMQTSVFRDRITALQQYCSRKVDPASAKLIPSIADPLELPRPTIGMKRNILCAAPFTAGVVEQKPEIIMSVDDDDWRSPSYTKNTVDRLNKGDWTKLISYPLAIYRSDDNSLIWGQKDFSLDQNVHDSYGMPSLAFSGTAHIFKAGEGFKQADPQEAFNVQRWHPLSTDGAVHALSYNAWERTVELFDGYIPVSYNEDTLMFEALRMLGRMHEMVEACRHDYILTGLTGNRTYTPDQINADRAQGPAQFNPEPIDRQDFVRLCCANVSPVAFSHFLPQEQVAPHMKQAFSFIPQHYGNFCNGQKPTEQQIRLG